jgi:hypothetical protein
VLFRAFATCSATRDVTAAAWVSHVGKLFKHSTIAPRIQCVHERTPLVGDTLLADQQMKRPYRLPHPAWLYSRKVPDTTGANDSLLNTASADR